jgi:hypothetical protein
MAESQELVMVRAVQLIALGKTGSVEMACVLDCGHVGPGGMGGGEVVDHTGLLIVLSRGATRGSAPLLCID